MSTKLELPEHTGIALMHLGYSLDNCIDALDAERYGDYNQYLENVQKLIEQIKSVDKSRVLYFIEKKHKTKFNSTSKRNGNGIVLQDDAFIVYTNDCGGNVVGARFCSNQYTRNEFYGFLAEQNIRNVFVGGEWAYYNGCIGCLGEMVRIFSLKRISVSPLAGCIYPLNPPQKMNRILERIYSNPVVFNN